MSGNDRSATAPRPPACPPPPAPAPPATGRVPPAAPQPAPRGRPSGPGRRLRRLRRRAAAGAGHRRRTRSGSPPRRAASSGSASTSRREAELDAIAARYGLHPLAVEDAVYAHQRPKLEHYDDALFMVLKTATYVEHEQLTATSEVVDTGEVMVFLGAALRDHRAARGARRAGRAAPPAGGAARPAVPGPVRRPLRRRRPRRRHLRRGRRRRRGGRRRARGLGLQPRAHRRHRPALPAQARADVAAQGGRPAGGAAAEAGRAADRRRPRGDALLLPRRAGPRHPRARPGRRRWTSCCPRSCRRRWPGPRWPTTRTCARSRPRPASSPSPPRSPASTA